MTDAPPPTPAAGSLRHRTVSGALWNTAARVVQQGLQIGTTLYVSHLLPPADFGLVAMTSVFTGFASVLAELGLGSALVREPDLDDRQTDTVFWFSVLLGTVLTLTFLASGGLVARFYSVPALAAITRVVSLVFVFNAITVVPRSLLYRRLEFDHVARTDMLVFTVNCIVLVSAARAGAHAWSLVYAQVTSAVLGAVALLVAARYRPRLRFDFAAVRPMMRFGLNFTGFNLLNYWGRSLDNLLAGKFIGADALGAYSRAYALMLLPIYQVVGILGQVMFPALSSIQDDKPRIKRIFLRAEGIISLITFPMMAGLLVVADSFVYALMGAQWHAAIPVIRILAPVGAVQSLSNPTGAIYTSQGRTDWLLRWGVGAIIPILIAICIGAWLGSIVTIAWAYFTIAMILVYPSLEIPGRLIGMRAWEVLRVCVGPALASTAMALAVLALDRTLVKHTGVSVRVRFAANVALGAVTYAAIVIGFRLSAFLDLRETLRNRGR